MNLKLSICEIIIIPVSCHCDLDDTFRENVHIVSGTERTRNESSCIGLWMCVLHKEVNTFTLLDKPS